MDITFFYGFGLGRNGYVFSFMMKMVPILKVREIFLSMGWEIRHLPTHSSARKRLLYLIKIIEFTTGIYSLF
jgi:hypothetical protein